MGIDEVQRGMIFLFFVQVSQGEVCCEQGVGFGLYIVWLIFDVMGGMISVGCSDVGGVLFVWCFVVVVSDVVELFFFLDEFFQLYVVVVCLFYCLLFEDVEINCEVVQYLLQCVGYCFSFW